MMPPKFAKLFDSEKFGQILATIDVADQDDLDEDDQDSTTCYSQIIFAFHPNIGTAHRVTTSMPLAEDNELDPMANARKTLDQIDLQHAERVVEQATKHAAPFLQPATFH